MPKRRAANHLTRETAEECLRDNRPFDAPDDDDQTLSPPPSAGKRILKIRRSNQMTDCPMAAESKAYSRKKVANENGTNNGRLVDNKHHTDNTSVDKPTHTANTAGTDTANTAGTDTADTAGTDTADIAGTDTADTAGAAGTDTANTAGTDTADTAGTDTADTAGTDTADTAGTSSGNASTAGTDTAQETPQGTSQGTIGCAMKSDTAAGGNVTCRVNTRGIFANPFADAAKIGSTSFLQTSLDFSKVAPLTNVVGSKSEEDELVADDEQVAVVPPAVDEADEIEKFACTNVTLLKSIDCPISDEDQKSTETEPKQPATQKRFKRCGDGLLKILAPKDAAAGCSASRLLMRQKGTSALLLNSPLSASQHFTVVDLPSAFALKFFAIDCTRANGEAPLAELFGAFCIKFVAKASRDEFLSAVAAIRKGDGATNVS